MQKNGEITYGVVANWEKLPDGLHHRDVSGVAVDSQDRVYVLTRGEPRVIIYGPGGEFLEAWPQELFTNGTHGMRVGADGSAYCVDNGTHTVRKFNSGGELELVLGTPGVASDTGYDGGGVANISYGGPPFNAPTGLTLAPNGDIYVSDGYANARIHHFSADGNLVASWGEPGNGPGEFNLPHAVWYTDDDRLLVADRENDRIQIFDPEGKLVDQWTHVQRPTDVCMDSDGHVYVSELAWLPGESSLRLGQYKEKQPGRLSILDRDGTLLSRIGGDEESDSDEPGIFWAPHSICVDSRGDIYVGEVCYSFGGFGEAGSLPSWVQTLQKLTRID